MNTNQVNQLNLNTMAAEQSTIELIFERQNELTIDDFIQWLNTNYEELKSQHKMEVMGAYECGLEDSETERYAPKASLDFYNQFYG
jgi:hypothetical protein